MSSIACTLFENHYHFGVATLINSLYNNGYKGDFFVGYRGDLPEWAINREDSPICWKGATQLILKEDLVIQFLPIHSDFHLANYKPTFMLELIDLVEEELESIAYFDPD